MLEHCQTQYFAGWSCMTVKNIQGKDSSMNTTRRFIMSVNWSATTGGVIFLFWMIRWLVTGNMPVCQEVWVIPHHWVFPLPPEPRWLDWLSGPIYSAALVWLLTSESMQEKRVDAPSIECLILYAGLATGLAIGLICIPLGGLITGLIIGLAFCAILAFGMRLVIGLICALGIGLGTGMIYGLIAGLGAGLVAGVTTGLVGAGLGSGIGVLLHLLFSGETWKAAWRWLMAQEEEEKREAIRQSLRVWRSEEESSG